MCVWKLQHNANTSSSSVELACKFSERAADLSVNSPGDKPHTLIQHLLRWKRTSWEFIQIFLYKYNRI